MQPEDPQNDARDRTELSSVWTLRNIPSATETRPEGQDTAGNFVGIAADFDYTSGDCVDTAVC